MSSEPPPADPSQDGQPSQEGQSLTGAIIVPVPEAESLVGDWRTQYDPSAVRGVPAHVTLLFPFLAADAVGEDGLAFLADLFATTPRPDARLVEVRQFPGVLYLAPEPANWFVALTNALSARFGLLPYGGVHENITPHLTIAQSAAPAILAEIAAQAAPALPITFAANEVWLMEQRDHGHWQHQVTFLVGTRRP
jgi:2'-5' RNA ligase